jgi:hypothetical protein
MAVHQFVVEDITYAAEGLRSRPALDAVKGFAA